MDPTAEELGVTEVSAANCGGLIEAEKTAASSLPFSRVSAANCGGLIEAYRFDVYQDHSGNGFRRKLRRPH